MYLWLVGIHIQFGSYFEIKNLWLPHFNTNCHLSVKVALEAFVCYITEVWNLSP